MNDYYKVQFKLTPPSEVACDLLAASLGDAGFESFVPSADFAVMDAYVPAAQFNPTDFKPELDDLPQDVAVGWQCELVLGRDWNAEWEKNYFQPIIVDDKVVVCGTFHTDVPEAPLKIYINPKMAFGTGHHATTVLMMRSILEGDDIACANVVDMGTGTGILAILASMEGARSVLAVEIDPFAAENTAENIALNLPPEADVELVCSDAGTLEGRGAFADVFLANINRNIITADIARYSSAMKPGARLTVSGFYVEDRPVVEAAAAKVGLSLRSVAELDRWSSMTFVKA